MKTYTDGLKDAMEVIKKHHKDARYGIFNTRNAVGDHMLQIFRGDGITIDICYDWGYFEVFGLSEDEFDKLEKYYRSINR